MTLELQEHLEHEMDDALAIENPLHRDEAVQTVQTHMLRALVDCQRKTSERVKTLVSDMTTIKADLAPCKESDKEYRETKLKAKGAKWAFASIFAVASVFGPIVAIKICKLVGILWSPAS